MVKDKLFQIQTEIKGLEKNTEAYNYKYVSGDKILREIRPRMDALHLILLPEVLDITNIPVQYDTAKDVKDYATKTTKTVVVHNYEVLTTLKMKFTWVDTEDGDTLECLWAANGCNKFDKGFGSALTYGERYYLLKLFHIATDADDVDYVSIDRDAQIERGLEAAAKDFDNLMGSPMNDPFFGAPAFNNNTNRKR